MDIAGIAVLVVGGSGELGRRIAARLYAGGSRLMLAARDAPRLAAAAAIGPGVATTTCDLRRPEDATRAVQATVDQLGSINGVVNAAGAVAFGALGETTDATLSDLVAVDLLGPLRVVRAALPHLEDGFVVSLTGVVAEQPMAGMAAYSAVKAGLSAATRALGRELRRRRVLVIDARPPHTETGLAARPIAGVAPPLPRGLDPDVVATRIVEAIAADERELASSDFRGAS